MLETLFKDLKGVRTSVTLALYSWWGIGGKADYLVEVNGVCHLQSMITLLEQEEIPYCLIGQGTNLLFDDAGYRGCVIRVGAGLSGIKLDGNRIEVEAGCWVPHLALFAARNNLSGLEHTIGIPASLGGLVCMNGGSQRKNIGSLIENVTVLTPDGVMRTDSNIDCDFGYRKSRYQSSGEIILSATLCFEHRRGYAEQRIEMLAILRERNRKFPRKLPSCGSVFKSSPELYDLCGPPGKIIEDLGFKGRKKGQIQVSTAHANFIVNLGHGSSADVLSLVHEIHTAVHEKTGISMQPEFLYVDPVLGPKQVL